MTNARRRTQRSTRGSTKAASQASIGGTAGTTTLDTEDARNGAKVNWANEMVYINKDLRELLIISVSLFALLFVVGFFL
jgi:hypothetical protein